MNGHLSQVRLRKYCR